MNRSTLWLVLLALLLGGGLAWQRQAISRAERRATAATAAADSLAVVADSLRAAYRVDTVRLRSWRTKWDSVTLPGTVDTIPKEVLVYVADSTIRACTQALGTCERRVAVERERGDSLQTAADQWKRVAKGPFLTPELEATTTLDWKPELAASLTLGRGRLQALARLAYTYTTTPSPVYDPELGVLPDSTSAFTGTLRVGVRWTP